MECISGKELEQTENSFKEWKMPERIEIEDKIIIQKVQPFITCNKELGDQIRQDYAFAERCRRDGILTYSRECEENKKIVNHLKEIIKMLEIEIQKEEENLKNIADGFKEMTYRMIDRMKSEKNVLEKLFEDKK